MLASLSAGELPTATTIRAVTTSPERFSNRPVRLKGRFAGRPAAPDGSPLLQPLNRTRWDFVLEANDGAVWVSGRRPVGRDFDLDPRTASASDSGRWLDVTGTVRVNGSDGRCRTGSSCPRVWIEASDLHLAAAPDSAPPVTSGGSRAAAMPQVVFHDPIADETGVSRATSIRLQFSRRMAAESFSGRVRISYGPARSLRAPPVPTFSASYDEDRRGLEIRFDAPLDAGEMVKVELLEGIRAADGRRLEPWVLTFRTGDS